MTTRQGMIRFASHALPAITPGAYRIDIAQTQLEGAQIKNEQRIVIGGSRFSLPPDVVYSVYPPPSGTTASADAGPGYAGTLPNIVFTRRTLPWERRPDGLPLTTRSPEPWLALLVLSAADFDGKPPPAPQVGTLRQLIEVPAAVSGPQKADGSPLTLAPHESPDTVCRFLDLPLAIVHRIAPLRTELALLAHTRSVSLAAKETWSLLTDGSYAVVCANRFPVPAASAAGVETLCLLVSLEGQTRVLERHDLGDKKTVRFVVLSDWRFLCGKADVFKVCMQNIRPELLRLPPARHVAPDVATQMLDAAVGRGYTLARLRTRVGAELAAWYRGPLAPYEPTRTSNPVEDLPTADSALSYDPQSGLLDTTFAAAWQLGRLLTLQNHGIATTIQRFRRRTGAILRAESEAWAAAQRLADRDLAAAVLDRQLQQSPQAEDPTPALLRKALVSHLDSLVSGRSLAAFDSRKPPAHEPDVEVPAELVRWCARITLLYGVPLEYMVPAPQMLPPESMRFFYLDRSWINAAILGSLSVGRVARNISPVDRLLAARLLSAAPREAGLLRAEAAGSAAAAAPPQDLDWPLTGFLLRSKAVAGWLGLDSIAKSAQTELVPLRIDRLRPDLLLCIYNGRVDEITIRQPPEGIHFGAALGTDGVYYKTVRRHPEGNAQAALGRFSVPLREGTQTVLNLQALADKYVELAGVKAPLRSADFAHFMIETPVEVIFRASTAK